MAAPFSNAEIPAWVTENQMSDLLKDNVEGFKRINKFNACFTGGAGENYQSVLVRVQINAELKDGSTKDVSFIIKTMPPTEQAAMMITMMGHFPRENIMYTKYLPTFKKLFLEAGKHVTFGPKLFTLKNNPGCDYILMDDLCLEGFKIQNRIEGLDKEHTEAVLKKIAQFHAASAVEYENSKGQLASCLVTSMFNEQTAEMFKTMMKPSLQVFLKCLGQNKICAKYEKQAKIMIDDMIDKFIELSKPDLEDFNVICHGDLWLNNIMFSHDVNGKIQETRFVDFQMSRYASPAIDLLYFLLTSPKFDIKIAHFDDFIEFYHENLEENLKLLNYNKKIPTLLQLHSDILKKRFWGFSTLTNTCAGILLDPSDCVNMEEFLKDGDAAEKVKVQLYTNPRYVKQLEVILPWMERRGYLNA